MITEKQALLHGSAPHPHDLDSLVREIENALRDDHLPELLELVGEKGWISEQVGKELVEAWKTDTHILFKSSELEEIPSSILWVGPSQIFGELETLVLRDVGFVRHNDVVLAQAMLDKG